MQRGTVLVSKRVGRGTVFLAYAATDEIIGRR